MIENNDLTGGTLCVSILVAELPDGVVDSLTKLSQLSCNFFSSHMHFIVVNNCYSRLHKYVFGGQSEVEKRNITRHAQLCFGFYPQIINPEVAWFPPKILVGATVCSHTTRYFSTLATSRWQIGLVEGYVWALRHCIPRVMSLPSLMWNSASKAARLSYTAYIWRHYFSPSQVF